MRRKRTRTQASRDSYKSELERRFGALLEKANLPFTYETDKFSYTLEKTYLTDFTLPKKDGTSMYLETKGYFDSAGRSKMLAVKKAHPELDIRFVFQRNNLISKASKTTYVDWATKNNFPCVVCKNGVIVIPKEWVSLLDLSNNQPKEKIHVKQRRRATEAKESKVPQNPSPRKPRQQLASPRGTKRG